MVVFWYFRYFSILVLIWVFYFLVLWAFWSYHKTLMGQNITPENVFFWKIGRNNLPKILSGDANPAPSYYWSVQNENKTLEADFQHWTISGKIITDTFAKKNRFSSLSKSNISFGGLLVTELNRLSGYFLYFDNLHVISKPRNVKNLRAFDFLNYWTKICLFGISMSK